MKSSKNLSQDKIIEYYYYQEKAVLAYRELNKIRNILLIGIGEFCNKAISEINKQKDVVKLFIDTDEKELEKYIDYPIIDLSEKNTKKSYDTQKQDKFHIIYDEISKYLHFFTNHDYIIICTTIYNEDYNLIAELIADYCKQQNKRFMICYTKENYSMLLNRTQNESEILTAKAFLTKIKDKKYILNEIVHNKTNFLLDYMEYKFHDKTCSVNMGSKISLDEHREINIDIFARILEINIIKMLKNEVI